MFFGYGIEQRTYFIASGNVSILANLSISGSVIYSNVATVRDFIEKKWFTYSINISDSSIIFGWSTDYKNIMIGGGQGVGWGASLGLPHSLLKITPKEITNKTALAGIDLAEAAVLLPYYRPSKEDVDKLK